MIKYAGKETMTIGELREKLTEFPPDMPVFATWETVLAPFKQDAFEIVTLATGGLHLEIDVEAY